MTVFRWGTSGGGGVSDAVSFAALMQRSVAWFDHYFSTTTYQEAAATTIADDPAERIGAWLDVFGRDVAATQATADSRPTLGRTVKGGRYNWLLETATFNSSYWAKNNMSVTANAGVAPDGTTTADKIIPSAAATTHVIQRVSLSPTFNNGSVYAKSAGLNTFDFLTNGAVNGARFDLDAGTFTPIGTTSSITMTAEAEGFYRCGVQVASAASDFRIYCPTSASDVSGNAVDGVLLWGAQAADVLRPYQAVGSTQYDVTQSGKTPLWYTGFDQVDDALSLTVPNLGTDAVVAYADENGVTFLEGQTIATSYSLITSNRLFALGIWDDPLTASEKAVIRRVMATLTEFE